VEWLYGAAGGSERVSGTAVHEDMVSAFGDGLSACSGSILDGP